MILYFLNIFFFWWTSVGLAATKLASMQKLNITTDTLISVYDVTHLKIKESSSGFEQEILAYVPAPCPVFDKHCPVISV